MNIKPPELVGKPAVDAIHIGFYVNDRMKINNINIYSAYILMHESLRQERLSYIQPAWGHKLSIRTLLWLYYDCLTGKSLKSDYEATESYKWFENDIPLLSEKRKHYLVNNLNSGASLLNDKSFYLMLSNMRRDYDKLNDDDGPFPSEVFPYDYAAPERELLKPGSESIFNAKYELDQESTDFYVYLQNKG